MLAEVSDLDEAENAQEAHYGTLLQVYLGVRTPTGQPLLFETYQPYDTIHEASRRQWLTSLPVLVGGLVLLYLVQAPLAYRRAAGSARRRRSASSCSSPRSPPRTASAHASRRTCTTGSSRGWPARATA